MRAKHSGLDWDLCISVKAALAKSYGYILGQVEFGWLRMIDLYFKIIKWDIAKHWIVFVCLAMIVEKSFLDYTKVWNKDRYLIQILWSLLKTNIDEFRY